MDTEALKAFVAINEKGSFSKAADYLNLTQPAVSKRIAALEQHLNQALFNRFGKEVTLTEAGAILLPSAKRILQSIADTERDLREQSGEVSGELRVATSHHIGLHHLPPVLRTFASTHKKVNLQFEFLDSEQALEKILRGDCELAVVTLAPKLPNSLESETLWQDPLKVVCSQDHPLAQHKSCSLSTLSKHAAILPGLNTFTGRLVKDVFEKAELPITLNMATNYLETIKMMVSVGLGWSVLPTTLIEPSMQIIHAPTLQLTRELGVIRHQKRRLGNAARAFYSVLTEHKQERI